MSTLAAPRLQRPLSRLPGNDIAIVLCIYAITRAISAVFILVAGRYQEGTAQFATNDPWNYYVWQPQPANPGYVDVLSNWDGQWYLRIANLGYLPSSDDPFGFADRAWAFPPLYPLTVAGVSGSLGISAALAAVLVSTVAGALAMVLLFRLTEPLLGRFGSFALVAVIGCYITAPLYQAAYTESMALLFLTWTLLDMRDRRYARMFVPMLLLVFTRLITPPLAIVAAVHLLVRQRSTTPASAREITLLVGYALVSVAGIGFWPWIASGWGGPADADRARVMLSAEHRAGSTSCGRSSRGPSPSR